MKMPHPGELRYKVEIGKTTHSVNGNGFPVDTETVLHTVWAGVEDAASSLRYAADAENAVKGLMFIIRWVSGIEAGMWVNWNGTKYTISKIGEYDFKRRYMRLTTEDTKVVPS